MKTNDKVAVLDNTITVLGMSDREFIAYAQKKMVAMCSCIKTDFPIVYKIGKDEYQTLSGFIPACKKQIWGLEIFPGFVMSVKYGSGKMKPKEEDFTNFPDKVTINGKKCFLPTVEIFEGFCSMALHDKINEAIEFLIKQGVYAQSCHKKFVQDLVACIKREKDFCTPWMHLANGCAIDYGSFDGKSLILDNCRLGAAF